MFTKLKQTFIGRPLKSLTEGEGDYWEKCRPWPCCQATLYLPLPMGLSK